MRIQYILCLTIFLFVAHFTSIAALPAYYSDHEVVNRSELIVIASLQPVSVKEGKDGILKITEVLKGNCEDKELPVIFHCGLSPEVKESGVITIADHSSSIMIAGDGDIVDAGKGNIWFLRKRHDESYLSYGRYSIYTAGMKRDEPDFEHYGIFTPNDFQSIKLKEYFKAFLADDPESAMLLWQEMQNDRAAEALAHIRIEKIMKITDLEKRYKELLPYFLDEDAWYCDLLTHTGMVSCGDVAGNGLIEIFKNSDSFKLRRHITDVWFEIEYMEAVPVHIARINELTGFFKNKEVEKRWKNRSPGSGEDEILWDSYEELERCISTLGYSDTQEVKEAIKSTRDQWALMEDEDSLILEACEGTLFNFTEDYKLMESALNMEDRDKAIVIIFDYLLKRYNTRADYPTAQEMDIILALSFENEMQNGGFQKFFLSSWGGKTDEVVRALENIGAVQRVKLLKKAIEEFRGKDIPSDQAERKQLVISFGEDSKGIWQSLDKKLVENKSELASLIIKYIENNRCEVW